MAKAKAFIRGLIEFRSDFTTAFDDLVLQDCYDHGRDLAHRLTLRHFD